MTGNYVETVSVQCMPEGIRLAGLELEGGRRDDAEPPLERASDQQLRIWSQLIASPGMTGGTPPVMSTSIQ